MVAHAVNKKCVCAHYNSLLGQGCALFTCTWLDIKTDAVAKHLKKYLFPTEIFHAI